MIPEIDDNSPLGKARAYLRTIKFTKEMIDFGDEDKGHYAYEDARGIYYDGDMSRPFRQLDPIILSQSLHHFISIDEHKIDKDQLLKPGTSKAKGLPDLPASIKWPAEMLFLAQFNLADLAQQDIQQMLPGHGMLYFFFSPANCESVVIHYDGPLEELAVCPYPEEDFQDRKYYTSKFEKSGYTLTFKKKAIISISNVMPLIPEEAKKEIESLLGCSLVDYREGQTLFGEPVYWQGENEGDYDDQRMVEADLLLLQYEFGEGNIHFWIAREELARRDFSKVWLTYSGT